MRNKLIVFVALILQLNFPLSCQAEADNITLNFMDEDIRVVFHTIATISGINIVVDDSVKGNVTIKISDIPCDTAINLITKSKGLSYRKFDNTILIEPADIGGGEVIKLQYSKPSDIKKSLETVITGLKIRMDADDFSNSIIVNGPSSSIDKVKTIIASLDTPHQQVELEAKVVAISKTASKQLGIDWTWEATPQYPEVETTYETIYQADGTQVSVPKTTVTRKNNYGVIQFGKNPEGIPYEFYYQAQISALISKGNAEILARPKVMTINGKEAKILIGDRLPVLTEKTEDGVKTISIEYIDAGIKLTYTPTINADGQITAAVHTEVSTPTLVSDIKAYRISTREADTNVRMKDGETLVIGGLIGNETSKTNKKVPFLGDLPLLGKLFSSVNNSGSDTEVVIFLTARIVK